MTHLVGIEGVELAVASRVAPAQPAAQLSILHLSSSTSSSSSTTSSSTSSNTTFATVALNDTHHLAWDGSVVEYINTTHHIAHETDTNMITSSTIMTHEEHNLTFIPGGPAGTVAINGTHHTTSTGDVIEAMAMADTRSSTHHIASDGLVTSHVEANLTREFHGLTDEHLDNHAAAGTTPDLVHLYHPEVLAPAVLPSSVELSRACETSAGSQADTITALCSLSLIHAESQPAEQVCPLVDGVMSNPLCAHCGAITDSPVVATCAHVRMCGNVVSRSRSACGTVGEECPDACVRAFHTFFTAGCETTAADQMLQTALQGNAFAYLHCETDGCLALQLDTCSPRVVGCQDSRAANYDQLATTNDPAMCRYAGCVPACNVDNHETCAVSTGAPDNHTDIAALLISYTLSPTRILILNHANQ